MQVGVRNRLRHGITIGPAFEEYEACTAAGLSVELWDGGGYSPDFKAKVIAWHRIHNAISAHVADAQNEYQRFEQKKAAQRAKARRHSR